MSNKSSKPASFRSSAVSKSARYRTKLRITKQSKIVDLLGRRKGASLVELTEATGWQPHSVRAALTGLRKQQVHIERTSDKRGSTIYRIVAEVSS